MMDGNGFREGTVTAGDGLRLYFRDYGPAWGGATPVLCLAGLTRNSRDFHHLAERLADRRRVVCPDLRGRGWSGRDPYWRHYHPRVYLDDLRHLLIAARLDRVAVIGTSLGGLLGMGLAVTMPTAVAGAVLNDVGPEIDPRALAPLAAYMRDNRPVADWAAAVVRLKKAFPTLPARTDDDWLAIARGAFRERPDGLLEHDFDPGLTRALEHGLGDVPDLWPMFRALRDVPVLAVRGALSEVLTAATLQAMAAALPAMAQVTVPDVGHAPSLLEPAAAGAIDAFLDRVD